MHRRLPALCLVATLITLWGCDPGMGDPADGGPSDPSPQAVEGDVAAGVVLLWKNISFQDPGGPEVVLAGEPVGTLLPVEGGAIDLAGVEPPFGLYHNLCLFAESEPCPDDVRMAQDLDVYALAGLATTDAETFDVTFDALDGFREALTHAPGHLLLFVRAPFDPSLDLYFERTGIDDPIEPGVYLIGFRSKRDMTLMPLDAEAIRFTAGADPPNLF